MNSCFEALLPYVISRESYNVISTICVAPFFSGILSLRYPHSNQIWISVRYDGWNIFPRVIITVFMWPGKVMSCPAHLAGGPIVIYSFSAWLSILPWGNGKTYSISCFRWILCIQNLTFAWRPCQCYLEACLWYSDFQQEHLKPSAKMFLAQLSKRRCMGNVLKFLSPYLRGFLKLYPDMISCSACPWEGYIPEICVLTHFPFHCSV